MRAELKALTGVDIMLDENTFKSTAKIIQEIGENWDKLTDVSQAATLEKLAGKVLPENIVIYLKYIFNCKGSLKLYATI